MNRIRNWLMLIDKYFYRKFDDWDDRKIRMERHYFLNGIDKFIDVILKLLSRLLNK